MQEKDALIDTFDEQGENIGHKFRHEVDKRIDILKQVNIILLNDENKVFVTKSTSELWPDKWGSSAAGLVRHDESLPDAAKRTLKRELGVDVELKWLGENYYNFDGVRRFMSVFIGTVKGELKANPEDVQEGKWVTLEETDKLDGMPTLHVALEIVKDAI